jgi:cell division protein FtsB
MSSVPHLKSEGPGFWGSAKNICKLCILTNIFYQPGRNMQILIAALITALMMSQYLLWINEDGIKQTLTLRISIQAQTEENAALMEGNRALEADIKDLKTGLVAIEERARSEMGMIRHDETFYRLLEQSKPSQKDKLLQTTSQESVQPLAVQSGLLTRPNPGAVSKSTYNMLNATAPKSARLNQLDAASRSSVPDP